MVDLLSSVLTFQPRIVIYTVYKDHDQIGSWENKPKTSNSSESDKANGHTMRDRKREIDKKRDL